MHENHELFEHILARVDQHAGHGDLKISCVAGGDINQSFRLERNGDSYFVKVNDATAYPDMFETEAKGLCALGEAAPTPLAVGRLDNTAYLVLPWIHSGAASALGQEALGQLLAAAHWNTAPQFGLVYDNYIGSLHQTNAQQDSWSDFYITQRLEPQLKFATDQGLIDKQLRQDFVKLFGTMQDFDPREKPSLVHGDLWGGNFLISANGHPYLIDPAIYYGCREMDIAMTLLFGGFSAHFYDGYREAFPPREGWQSRIDLWQLYPLLVHVNLFGSGYLSQLKGRLRKYV